MSEVFAWIAAAVAALLGGLGMWKWVEADRAKKDTELVLDEMAMKHWKATIEKLSERAKRIQAEQEAKVLRENREIADAVRNNPRGSVVKRWNRGGRREAPPGDDKQHAVDERPEGTGRPVVARGPTGSDPSPTGRGSGD